MANHASAFKRARQNLKRADRNQALKSDMRSQVKKAILAVEKAKDRKEAMAAFVIAEKALQKAASKNVIPRERANRKTSRIAIRLNSQFKS